MTATQTELPGWVAGTWQVDPAHSEVSFVARHLFTKVRGVFRAFEGTIVTTQNPLESKATAEIDLTSVDTGNETRDNHLRTADFFSVDEHKSMTWETTTIRPVGGNKFQAEGLLTIRGVAKPVTLDVEYNGIGQDPWGGTRLGVSATAEVNRHDWGVSWNAAIETGGFLVGDKVQLVVEIQAVLQP
jgi:polyisoprenoid-binding protein YceI